MRLALLFFCLYSFGRIVASCPLNCENHGTCQGSVCYCQANYEGDDCSIYDETLSEGVSASNSVEKYEWKYYNIQVPHSGVSMSWWLNRTTDTRGDCDLYIAHGNLPDRANFLARNISTLHNLNVVIMDAKAGTYYAGAYGYRGCSYDIAVDFIGACPDDCSQHGQCLQGACRCYSGYSGDNCGTRETSVIAGTTYDGSVEFRGWNYYSFMATSTVDAVDWILTKVNPKPAEDCDMYVKKDSYPSMWEWDYANVSLADVLVINQTEVTTGTTYYLGVYGYYGCNYNLLLTEVFPSDPADCPNNCSNHGQGCSRNRCTCNDAYAGVECEEYILSLQEEQVMTGYVGDNSWNYYHIYGDTENSFVVTLNRTSESGDCDLYVQSQKFPTRLDYSYMNISTKDSVSVVIPEPNGETWYLGVFGWYPCTYALTVESTTRCGCSSNGHGACLPNSPICVCDRGWSGDDCSIETAALVSGIPVKGSTVTENQWRYFSIHAKDSTAFSLTVKETNSTGEVWVFVRAAEYPTLSAYDYSDKDTHNAVHQISYYTPLEHSGDLYIGIYGSPFIPDASQPGKPNFATFDLVAWVSDF